MTVTALSQPSPGELLLAAVGAARGSMEEAAAVALGGLTDDQLEAAVAAIASLESQAQAVKLGLCAEAERRAVEKQHADTGTDAWLARLTGERREMLKGGLRLAKLLEERYTATLQALAEGRIRLEQARIIVDGLELTADQVEPALVMQAEELMIGKASGEGTRTGTPIAPSGLRRAVRHAYSTLDGDIHLMHLKESVRRRESRAKTDTWLVMGDRGDGTYSGKFSIPERHGAWLKSILQCLFGPRSYTKDKDGNGIVDESAEDLGYYDQMGRAFCELIEHLPKDRLPRSAVTMLVRVDLETLRDELEQGGVATMDGGIDLSAAETRKLACEAGIVPAVMGGESTPLDLGRTRRLFTDKQRQALALIYDTCAIAGCGRPFDWCEIHHLRAWANGGRTDLADAAPFCGHHHRAVENPAFELRRHSDTEFTLHRIRRR